MTKPDTSWIISLQKCAGEMRLSSFKIYPRMVAHSCKWCSEILYHLYNVQYTLPLHSGTATGLTND